MTRSKIKVKKAFRSVADTMTLGGKRNKINQTRPLQKRGIVKTWYDTTK